MTTLSEWLLAQIAEDEAVALHSRGIGGSGWAPGSGGIYWSDSESGELHIDPARVLAECEAKRRIVELRERAAREAADPPEGAEMLTVSRVSALNETLRTLALPYADRPGYREEWRP